MDTAPFCNSKWCECEENSYYGLSGIVSNKELDIIMRHTLNDPLDSCVNNWHFTYIEHIKIIITKHNKVYQNHQHDLDDFCDFIYDWIAEFECDEDRGFDAMDMTDEFLENHFKKYTAMVIWKVHQKNT